MTNREQEVLEIIKKNPMISQNEIASQLDLTRSSVSVYITNLLKSGALKGRGYIIEDECYPVIVGTSALDITSVFDAANIDNDPRQPQKYCNISFSYSGGAKNVAEYITRLDGKPQLISALARDQFGERIASECNQHGISTQHSLFLDNASTTMFLEVKSPEIQITGLASSPIDQNITPAFLETKYVHLKKAGLIAIEDRLSKETIDYLTSTFRNIPLYLLTSRRFSNVENYREYLNRFTAMQFSFLVASHLVGMDNLEYLGKTVDDNLIIRIARGLMDLTQQERHIIFPAPGSNICYVHMDHLYVITPPDAAEELDQFKSTRDAMIAGLMYCLSKDFSPEDTLFFVAACNDVAMGSSDTFNREMCIKLVETTIQKLKTYCSIRQLF